MMPANDELQGEIDRLYGLPLDQFTAARDELALTLRRGGQREAAAEVKRLRKPNLPAWALNQVRRRHRDRVEELIRTGSRLRDAQQRLVAGGERGLLRSAAADERRLVEELAALAGRELAQAGHPHSAALESKLGATAHAAALTAEAGELLAAGRLVRDYEISDLGLIAAGARKTAAAREAAARRAAARRAAERKQARLQAAARIAAERKAQVIRRQLDRARARVTELEAALRELEL